MLGGYWRIKLLIHLTNHYRRPVYEQQKDCDALCLLPGHPTGKVSPNNDEQYQFAFFSVHYIQSKKTDSDYRSIFFALFKHFLYVFQKML